MAASHALSIPSVHTFLNYGDPIKMEPDEPDPPLEKTTEWLKFWLFRTSDMRFIPDPRLVEYVSEYKKCKRKESPEVKTTRLFLENLFPTKYWTDNGERYKQKVSMVQATRPALKNTIKKLDTQMEKRQANKVVPSTPSYCPIRYTLHIELFDELIRQVTLECRFRGYMLNRVRGELFETLDSYKSLVQTSLVEDSRVESLETLADPETLILKQRVADLESELAVLQRERFYSTTSWVCLWEEQEQVDPGSQ